LLVTYAAWGWITRSRVLFVGYFVGFCVAASALTYWYSDPEVLSPGGDIDVREYNDTFRDYTGGNFTSGRHILWPALTKALEEHAVLGYGPGAQPSEIVGIRISSHSLYLQIWLQTGLVGLCSFLFLLFAIWSGLWRGRYHPLVRVAGSAMVGILTRDVFAVTLTQVNLPTGLLGWTLIGIGLSIALRQDRTRAPLSMKARLSVPVAALEGHGSTRRDRVATGPALPRAIRPVSGSRS
jgi:hypothetical protein